MNRDPAEETPFNKHPSSLPPGALIDQSPVKTRLYVPDALFEGATIGTSPAQAHYLRTVLRLERGAEIGVFNGQDGEYRAVVDGFGRGWCSLTLVNQRRTQSATSDLWLVFAPIKRARFDFVAEKATELGVSGIWPIYTGRTVVHRVKSERLMANVIEAAEQSERLTLPEVREPDTLANVLKSWPAERRLFLCAEVGEAEPLVSAFQAAEPGPQAIMTGPEGGFAPAELDALRALPFVTPVSLGPRVLRADTAALSALACWQASVGDWHGRRPPRAVL